MTFQQAILLTVIGVASAVVIVAVAVVMILRSNRRLANEYQSLRAEAMDQWRTYLENEHQRVLSETAAAVARINALAGPLLRDAPSDGVEPGQSDRTGL